MPLTQSQHGKLDRLAKEKPDTKVVGLAHLGEWEVPIIRYAEGGERRIMPNGRLKTGGL